MRKKKTEEEKQQELRRQAAYWEAQHQLLDVQVHVKGLPGLKKDGAVVVLVPILEQDYLKYGPECIAGKVQEGLRYWINKINEGK